jgi:hypothetical protein
MEVRRMEEKRRESGMKKRRENKILSGPPSATDSQSSSSPPTYLYIPPFRVLGTVKIRVLPIPARLGYHARARPSWIIRGACPLHDLMEVRIGEETGGKSDN